MQDVPAQHKPALVTLLLALADDKLLLGHLNSDWTGLGPILEEDIAFSHLAQDEIAHAQAIYDLAGQLVGKSADELAFGRPPEEFRSCALVEVPDEFDWATAIARKLFCDHFDLLRLTRMANSEWKPLRDLARRMADEEKLHVEHTDSWIIRLGAGTQESHGRMQQALDALVPMATTPFEPFDGLKGLVDAKFYAGSDFTMYDEWLAQINRVLDRATLKANIVVGEPEDKGGRRGVHTKYLQGILDEMCEVWRTEPNAKW
jgi:ring-1,2-phenylacetyl-CoA epoxidase subunit PaaC